MAAVAVKSPLFRPHGRVAGFFNAAVSRDPEVSTRNNSCQPAAPRIPEVSFRNKSCQPAAPRFPEVPTRNKSYQPAAPRFSEVSTRNKSCQPASPRNPEVSIRNKSCKRSFTQEKREKKTAEAVFYVRYRAVSLAAVAPSKPAIRRRTCPAERRTARPRIAASAGRGPCRRPPACRMPHGLLRACRTGG